MLEQVEELKAGLGDCDLGLFLLSEAEVSDLSALIVLSRLLPCAR